MFLIDQIAEEKIQQAIAEGKFDNLSTRGQPYRFDGYLYEPPADRVVNKILRDHNYLPEFFYWRKKIEELDRQIDALFTLWSKRYQQIFVQLVELMELNPGYDVHRYWESLERHRRFVRHHFPIWLQVKESSQVRALLDQFHRLYASYRRQYLELAQKRCELVDLHNEEVLRHTLKHRDRFRIHTTLARESVERAAERFEHRFPLLPRFRTKSAIR